MYLYHATISLKAKEDWRRGPEPIFYLGYTAELKEKITRAEQVHALSKEIKQEFEKEHGTTSYFGIISLSLIHESADTKTLDEAFDRWWWYEGSGDLPLPGHDHEEHAHRIARIAWHNGAYCQNIKNNSKPCLAIVRPALSTTESPRRRRKRKTGDVFRQVLTCLTLLTKLELLFPVTRMNLLHAGVFQITATQKIRQS